MPSEPDIVILDTSFLIRLLGNGFPLHSNATEYFEKLLHGGYSLAIPVVAIGEYLVRGNNDEIPYRSVRILPYNLEESLLAGRLARHLFEQRTAGTLDITQRTIIPNDVKIYASAQTIGARAIVTADEESGKLFTSLRSAGLITFEWWHIGTPLHEYLGLLPI